MTTIHRDSMRVPLLVWDGDGKVPMEQGVFDQLARACSMPFVHHHAALMPDGHVGIGCSVGSVIPTKGAIVPAAVGVDLGCGMIAARLDMTASDLPDNLDRMRSAIEADIPHGRTNNGKPGDRGAWGDPPADAIAAWATLDEGWQRIVARDPTLSRGATVTQLGTLGTGNHFIEVCLDLEQRVWVMLHSGSRGVGNRVGSHFIARAKARLGERLGSLPDRDLAWLSEGTVDFSDYVEAVRWAQEYARVNRVVMLRRTIGAIERILGPIAITERAVACHHNYVSEETHFGERVWVTRKGAVSAKLGELGIIPGSMGARSFIVRGKGNADSFESCSHGAGRVMSRTEARKRITLEDHAKATEGISCRQDPDVVDESPAAYKRIEDVMAAQADLVEIVHELRQVLCVKG